MPVFAGDHLRITATLSMPLGTVAQNVFYVQVQSLGGGDDQTVLDDLRNWLEGIYLAIQPILSDAVTAVLMEVAKQVLGGSISPIGSRVLSVTGNALPDMVSHGVAGQTNMNLVGGGRPSIKFWAGTNEAGITDGEYLSLDLASMANAAITVVLGPNVGVALGQYLSGIITGDTQAFKSFTGSLVVKTIPGYQRRRKPGVGI